MANVGPQGENEDAKMTRKIKLQPTKEEAKKLNMMIDAAHWAYNQCVAVYKRGTTHSGEPITWGPKGHNLRILRDELKQAKEGAPWTSEKNGTENSYLYEFFDKGVVRFDTALRTEMKKVRKSGKAFEMQYKAKRLAQQLSTVVNKRDYHQTKGRHAFLKRIKHNEHVDDDKISSEIKYTRTRTGKYYMCVTYESEMETSKVSRGVVSLDPGVRTFQTMYCPEGHVVEFGANDMYRLIDMCRGVDKIQSKMDTTRSTAHKNRLQKAFYRRYERIRNRVAEMHKKTAVYLVQNYSVILLPKFDTQQMITKKQGGKYVRAIGSKTARAMVTWSHYSFRQHLLQRARRVENCSVVLCDEYDTSKTCGKCGHKNHELGASKTFKCPVCTHIADRDFNAARNILLRFMAMNVKNI